MPETHLQPPVTSRSSLVDVLRWHAEHRPEGHAFTFLLDGQSDEAQLTYGALDEKVRALAARLQDMGVSGGRALLLYQPGLDYIVGFLGCLYAGVTAVPSYPPDPFRMERTFPRFQAIVKDSQPAVFLSSTMILEMAGDMLAEHPDFQGVQAIASDGVPLESAGHWQDPGAGRDTLAFLQYTSGSTADPKGVMLTHGNLLANLELIRQCFRMDDSSVGMVWLPPYHDMGLIGGILEPMYVGVPMVLMSPLDFLQRPLRWLQAVSRYRVTVSGGPNFAYDLCARKVTDAQKAELDLSSWDVAFNGAEPVRRETMERFAEAFASCGFRKDAFYPCYGLAEATLIVSGGDTKTPPTFVTVQSAQLGADRIVVASDGQEGTQTLVGCGRTLGSQRIVIADPEREVALPEGQVGEIWVMGDSIAQGYWNRPEESQQTFGAHLADSGEGPFLRTGDLGFLQAGELFVTGRIKDLIIVDGRNQYPQDIELTVENCHPAFRPGCVAAFPVTAGGSERVVVAVEVYDRFKPLPATLAGSTNPGSQDHTLDPQELVAVIRRAVSADHDLRVQDVALLKARTIPKTSSGKIQRRACRAAYLAGSLDLWAS